MIEHFAGDPLYFQQTLQQPTRCECHSCTQIRWKTSLQGQMEEAMKHSQQTQEPEKRQKATECVSENS